MSDAVIDPITGPVPPPHRAVVQTQRGKPWQFAAGERFERVFFNLVGQNDAEPRDLFAEDFDDRISDPIFAETHPRRMASSLPRAGTLVGRMLKQRDTSFAPQAMADEQRRICGDRQQRSGDRLRQVIEASEFLRSDLQMNLEAAAASFEHYVVVSGMKLVKPLDVNIESSAAQLAHRAIQLVVARNRRLIVEGQIGLPNCRQYAR